MSDADPLDRGVAAERTALAHWRTTLATIVCGMLIVGQSDPGAERVVALVAALGAPLTIGGVGIRRRAALQRGEAVVHAASIAAVVLAVVTLEVAALVVVV